MKLGLPTIILNLQKISQILWEHLNNEDSWFLLQNLIRDTKGECYNLWIENGLGELVRDMDMGFKKSRFEHIFKTLSVFMEVCYDHIAKDNESFQEAILK